MEKVMESGAAQERNMSAPLPNSEPIGHKPSQQSAAFNSGTGAVERNLRTVEMPVVDLLEPPKLDCERKRLPKTRLEELQMIKDLFPSLYEPLCAAEQSVIEACRMRLKAPKEAMPKEKDSKEQELHALARKA